MVARNSSDEELSEEDVLSSRDLIAWTARTAVRPSSAWSGTTRGDENEACRC
jgi:hypothetical protein